MSANWPTIALGDLCSIARGGSPRPIKNFITNDLNGVNWIKIGDTQKGGRYIDSTAEKIKPEGISRSRFVEAGSFLLSNSMSFGRPYILRTSGCIHDGWLVLEPDYQRVNQDFLYHVLGSRTVFDQFDRLAAGSTVRNLNIALVEGVEIPLPPLEEQRRIVAVLDEAFEGLARARAHTEANLQNARELYGRCRDGLLEHGDGWEELPLSELIQNITYGFTNPMPNTELGPYKITAKNVINGRIDYKNARRTTVEAFNELLTDKSRPQIGDVLLTKDGTLGRTAVVDTENICINQSVAVMRPNSRILPEYLAEVLACSAHQEAMIAGAGGATIKHLYITRVPKIILEIPEVRQQKRLLETLEAMRSRCRNIEDTTARKLQDLDDLRQSLLRKAFAGELT